MIPHPDGLLPSEWADALSVVLHDASVPVYEHGMDWRGWARGLLLTAGGVLDVPRDGDYDDFQAWARDLIRQNGGR